MSLGLSLPQVFGKSIFLIFSACVCYIMFSVTPRSNLDFFCMCVWLAFVSASLWSPMCQKILLSFVRLVFLSASQKSIFPRRMFQRFWSCGPSACAHFTDMKPSELFIVCACSLCSLYILKVFAFSQDILNQMKVQIRRTIQVMSDTLHLFTIPLAFLLLDDMKIQIRRIIQVVSQTLYFLTTSFFSF